jgi:hypothetical protein
VFVECVIFKVDTYVDGFTDAGRVCHGSVNSLSSPRHVSHSFSMSCTGWALKNNGFDGRQLCHEDRRPSVFGRSCLTMPAPGWLTLGKSGRLICFRYALETSRQSFVLSYVCRDGRPDSRRAGGLHASFALNAKISRARGSPLDVLFLRAQSMHCSVSTSALQVSILFTVWCNIVCWNMGSSS